MTTQSSSNNFRAHGTMKESDCPIDDERRDARAEEKDATSTSSRARRKSWASGRVLTSAQRARKRELDKLSSRKRRQSNKDRIEQLENLLLQTTSNLERGVLPPASLAAAVQTTISPSYSTVSESSLGPRLSSSQSPHLATNITTLSTKKQYPESYANVVSRSAPLQAHSVSSDGLSTSSFNPFQDSYTFLPPPVLSNHPDLFFPTPADAAPQVPLTEEDPQIEISRIANDPPPVTVAPAVSTRLLEMFNELLHHAHRLQPDQICLDDQLNQNAILSGVLRGWDTIAIHGHTCPLWDVLQLMDTHVFSPSNLITRLSMLRMVHYMLMCQVKADGFRGVPPWYRPRPVQRKFQHELVKDYFAWPGLRERLVLSDEMILTDTFFESFARDFRLHWALSDSDTYIVDPNTGTFRFSGVYLNHLCSIHHWRMDHCFFEAYPALYDDIEPAEPVVPFVNLAASRRSAPRLIRDSSEIERIEDEEVKQRNIRGVAGTAPNLFMPSFNPWAHPESHGIQFHGIAGLPLAGVLPHGRI